MDTLKTNEPHIVDARTARVVDSAGRRLEVKRVGAVGLMKLYGAVGPERSENNRYVGFAMLAASVVKIDDTVIPPSRTAGEIESIVSRLDEHGLEAVASALKALNPPEEKDVAAAAENLSSEPTFA